MSTDSGVLSSEPTATWLSTSVPGKTAGWENKAKTDVDHATETSMIAKATQEARWNQTEMLGVLSTLGWILGGLYDWLLGDPRWVCTRNTDPLCSQGALS